jgi:hypothetical protein
MRIRFEEMKLSMYLVVLLLGVFSANAGDNFYVRCVDADNLDQIVNYRVKSQSKKLEIIQHGNGVVELINFQRGNEITIEADNFKEENYRRPDRRISIALRHNGEHVIKPGDTIVIQLLLNRELLTKRWEAEDQYYLDVDTTNVEKEPDVDPSFVSEQEFMKILSTKLHFPRHLVNENVSGTILISAIVEKDGKLSNIKIKRGLEPHLDRIALRALRFDQLPSLKPATKDNITVRSVIVLPFSFVLE